MATNFENIESSSGFSFQEEADLGDLMSEASSSSERVDDNDAAHLFGGDHQEAATEEAYPRQEEAPQQRQEEEAPELQAHEAEAYREEEAPREAQPPVAQEATPPQEEAYREPVVAQEAYENPVATTAPVTAKPRLGQQALDGRSVAQVIRIVDAYRLLDSHEADVAIQLIMGVEVDTQAVTLEELVLGVMTVDPMLVKITSALKEAKGLDPVERAFYAMELDDRVLEALGGLVEAFSGNPMPSLRSVRKTAFCRELVKAVDVIEPRDLRTIEATESVLAALEEG